VTRLQFERTNQRLSQAHVAHVAHIPQPTLSQIELGRLVPTPEELQRLAAVFGLTPSELLEPVVPR
jgi:transcriptional regulator with XRE-family HTH domain